MEQALLAKNEEKAWVLTRVTFVEELKRASCMVAPMMVVTVNLYLLEVISMSMAGHLSELSLSGVSMATSFTNVTGFSLLFAAIYYTNPTGGHEKEIFGESIMDVDGLLKTLLGRNERILHRGRINLPRIRNTTPSLIFSWIGMAGGLETLCGQAYGAEQYQKFGSYTYCAIISLVLICFPVSILWIFMDRILIAGGIDSDISMESCKYAICLIPALFASAFLQPLLRYFQSQSFIRPMLLSSCSTLCFHVPFCWALVYKWELGGTGAALAIGVSYWLNVIMLALYMRFSSSCEKTRSIYWRDIFSNIRQFLIIAFPSAIMLCLEWWTFELLTLLAGRLPDSKLETSVLSICLATTSLHFEIQYGIAAAGSTRVSNELGAGNPQAAQAVVLVVLIISVSEAIIMSTILFCCRHVYGYLFSNDKGVVDYVAKLTPLICLSIIMDSLQAVLSGIARGCGWQYIGAFINLGAYYFVGAPTAIILCFMLHLGSKGLRIGILMGTTVQATSFAVITALTDWQKMATEARERIFEEEFLADNELS